MWHSHNSKLKNFRRYTKYMSKNQPSIHIFHLPRAYSPLWINTVVRFIWMIPALLSVHVRRYKYVPIMVLTSWLISLFCSSKQSSLRSTPGNSLGFSPTFSPPSPNIPSLFPLGALLPLSVPYKLILLCSHDMFFLSDFIYFHCGIEVSCGLRKPFQKKWICKIRSYV